jgi:hypothetical protein
MEEAQKKYWTVAKKNKLSGKERSIKISTDKDCYPPERVREILEEIYPAFEIISITHLTKETK